MLDLPLLTAKLEKKDGNQIQSYMYIIVRKTGQNFTIIYFIGLDFGHSLGSPQEETAPERSEGLFPDQLLIIEPNILFYFFNFKKNYTQYATKKKFQILVMLIQFCA